MSLEPATRLGSYEIVGLLGKGGMGEVYRARDTKLHREVAIKILSPAVSDDPERRARFEREARAVAALSHPNILAVHEFGAHEGQLFVVMELLEGQTLRDLLQAGPMPLRKAVDAATQIARGLAAAHQKGLIHRDLKPENVFVLGDGQVKILDFGLARAINPPTDSATVETRAETHPGTVLGTVGYMSPEQVRAGVVDARADLFALGAVFFEMLAGHRAFQRDTAVETMTAILRDHPPELAGSRTDLPPALDRIVQHALEKDPQARFQTASDVVFALTSLSGSGVASSGPAPVTTDRAADTGRLRSRLVPPLVGGIALMVIAGAAGWAIGRRPEPVNGRWDQFTQLTDAAGPEHAPTISPDGSSFAYVSRTRGSWDIYVQRVGGRNPLVVAGDPVRQEAWPKFSADGRLIAFSEVDADGGIFITGATGESERRLTDFGAHPAWSPDGKQIAFATENVDLPYSRASFSQLWIVDVAGGAPRKIQEQDAVQPDWSPSGKRIAFWANIAGQRDLVTIASDGSDRVAVTNDAALDWAPEWSPDGRWLYFASDRGGFMGLWRIAMDEATGRPKGQPESVSAGVEAAMELPSFSSDGRILLFRSQLESVNPAAIPFDPATERTGTPRLLTTRTGLLRPASVSPDGEWVALSNLGERQEDLFVMRRDGRDLRRLTDDVVRDRGPRWTPDGTALVFYSNRDGTDGIWSIRPDGSGLTTIAGGRRPGLIFGALSPADGRLVAAPEQGPQSYFVRPPFPATADRFQPVPNTGTATEFIMPTLWSPDGKWLSGPWITSSGPAGVGVYDIAAGRARKVTSDRGIYVAPFLPDNRRVAYFTTDNELVVVDIFQQGSRRLIPVALALPAARDAFVIAPDGRTLYYGAQQIESNVWKVERAGSR